MTYHRIPPSRIYENGPRRSPSSPVYLVAARWFPAKQDPHPVIRPRRRRRRRAYSYAEPFKGQRRAWPFFTPSAKTPRGRQNSAKINSPTGRYRAKSSDITRSRNKNSADKTEAQEQSTETRSILATMTALGDARLMMSYTSRAIYIFRCFRRQKTD